MLTISNHKKKLKGLRVVIVGDIFHSRVARSGTDLLSRFGAKVIFCGPPDFVPEVAATHAPGVSVSRDLDAALKDADVVISLRVQKERLSGKHHSLEGYAQYQFTPERVAPPSPTPFCFIPGR